jgi:prolipoprotein diacylglyceryltransferase
MYSIAISMNPHIIDLGPLSIDWRGLMGALALIVGLARTVYLAKRAGMKIEQLFGPLLAAIVVGFIVSRLFERG